MAAFGWWDTEAEDNEYDWRKSNINILTDADPPYDPGTGSVQLRGIPVRVFAEEPQWPKRPEQNVAEVAEAAKAK